MINSSQYKWVKSIHSLPRKTRSYQCSSVLVLSRSTQVNVARRRVWLWHLRFKGRILCMTWEGSDLLLFLKMQLYYDILNVLQFMHHCFGRQCLLCCIPRCLDRLLGSPSCLFTYWDSACRAQLWETEVLVSSCVFGWGSYAHLRPSGFVDVCVCAGILLLPYWLIVNRGECLSYAYWCIDTRQRIAL